MAETENAVVVTRRLTKVFRDFWLREKVTAVSDLDLDVQPREVFGLLGPNGSGKSTTLKMILGLLFPTRGTISVFGKLPTDVAIKSRIGFLPEDSYLYPFLDAARRWTSTGGCSTSRDASGCTAPTCSWTWWA